MERSDDYHPVPSLGDRLFQLCRALLGDIVVRQDHVVALAVLLTQAVGPPLWLAGAGYLLAFAVGMLFCPGTSAALYSVTGLVGIALMQIVLLSVSERASVRPRRSS